MIPKIIHYCWFGRNKKSPLAEKCIDSWKKYCPEYEIKEWNEDNFDMNCCQFVKEAYATKKWAFVADYARLFILKEYGGVYMDTDVEVVKPLDDFLMHFAFAGIEYGDNISTALIGSEANNQWISYLLTYYDNRRFIRLHGKCDTTNNVEIITQMIKNNKKLIVNYVPNTEKGIVTIYPKEYFCPKDYTSGTIIITDNTYAIHHFDGSWCYKSKEEKNMDNNIINRVKRLILKVKLKLNYI